MVARGRAKAPDQMTPCPRPLKRVQPPRNGSEGTVVTPDMLARLRLARLFYCSNLSPPRVSTNDTNPLFCSNSSDYKYLA
jgi:hypothetical protein